MESQSNQPPLIVIVGETGSGKSALALELAQRFNGEIICADSWTVYKGFDIGTAKPTGAERRLVPHHLLDIANPRQGFSAAEFQKQALRVIADISSRGKIPFLVGGTGLYIDSIIFSYSFLPPATPQIRNDLNKLSLTELQQKARSLGLDLESIDLRNKRRIIRLLENNGLRPKKQSLRPHTLLLEPALPQAELEKKIDARVTDMMARGLEAEVKKLAQTYGWEAEPMKGIGYREWQPYFMGAQTIAQTKERIVRSTLQLAKKQRTWFKRNKSIHSISKQAEVVALITTFLNK